MVYVQYFQGWLFEKLWQNNCFLLVLAEHQSICPTTNLHNNERLFTTCDPHGQASWVTVVTSADTLIVFVQWHIGGNPPAAVSAADVWRSIITFLIRGKSTDFSDCCRNLFHCLPRHGDNILRDGQDFYNCTRTIRQRNVSHYLVTESAHVLKHVEFQHVAEY